MTDEYLQQEELENEILNIIARSGYSVEYNWLENILPENMDIINSLISSKYLTLYLDDNNKGFIRFTKLGLSRLFNANQDEAVINFASYMEENNISTLELCNFLAEDEISRNAAVNKMNSLKYYLECHKELLLTDDNKTL